jgi:pimeloyl-ACP methyl ester carboxylesterase
MLQHGWPATFQQMQKIIPLLTDPARHGGEASDSFDVIVPSFIGYGFSDRPKKRGMTVFRIGDLFAKLMAEIGYENYAVRASNLGAGVAQQLSCLFKYLDRPSPQRRQSLYQRYATKPVGGGKGFHR